MEALAQLEGHPHIVQAYDFLADPDSDDTYWLLLEYVEGETLESYLMESKDIFINKQLEILGAIADALNHCHRRNILHRNLTPASIFLTVDGSIKVGNFDYARVPMLGFTISQTGEALVQTRYTAPEQLSDPRTADYRADLYSLGAIWYDMLFRPGSEEPMLVHQVDNAPISTDAKELLESLLSHRAADRPESAADVVDWFELLKG